MWGPGSPSTGGPQSPFWSSGEIGRGSQSLDAGALAEGQPRRGMSCEGQRIHIRPAQNTCCTSLRDVKVKGRIPDDCFWLFASGSWPMAPFRGCPMCIHDPKNHPHVSVSSLHSSVPGTGLSTALHVLGPQETLVPAQAPVCQVLGNPRLSFLLGPPATSAPHPGPPARSRLAPLQPSLRCH